MRYLMLSSLLWLGCAACADDDANVSTAKGSETQQPDAGTGPTGEKDKDAAASSRDSRLVRPALPRPPGKGLPAELHPPR